MLAESFILFQEGVLQRVCIFSIQHGRWGYAKYLLQRWEGSVYFHGCTR